MNTSTTRKTAAAPLASSADLRRQIDENEATKRAASKALDEGEPGAAETFDAASAEGVRLAARLRLATEREAASNAEAAEKATTAEQARLAEMLQEVGPEAWEAPTEELALEAIAVSKTLLALVERADARVREARGTAQAARALARALNATVSIGAWDRALDPIIGRVQRRLAEQQMADGVPSAAADLAAELVEPGRVAARYERARKAGA